MAVAEVLLAQAITFNMEFMETLHLIPLYKKAYLGCCGGKQGEKAGCSASEGNKKVTLRSPYSIPNPL